MRATEVPLAVVMFVVGVGALMWGLYALIKGERDDARSRRQAQAEEQALLAEVEALNREVVEVIHELTALARRQLACEIIEGEAEQVNGGFAEIEEVLAEYSKPDLRTWVKAVTDRYRFTVRRLVESVDNGEDPVIAAEVLEDVHRMTVVDLRVKQMKDGRIMVHLPRNPDGTPFVLQKAQAEYERSQAKLGETRVDNVRRS